MSRSKDLSHIDTLDQPMYKCDQPKSAHPFPDPMAKNGSANYSGIRGKAAKIIGRYLIVVVSFDKFDI